MKKITRRSMLKGSAVAAAALALSACGGSSSSSSSASSASAAASAAADGIGFPKNETITLAVPGKAGGGSDLAIRYYSEGLNRIYGLKTTVTNYDSNTVGHQTVANAKPDGTTLTLATSSLNIQYITGNATVNPMTDFTLIACLQDNGFSTLAVPANAPYDDFQGFVDYAKSHPNELNAGMPAAGANTFLFGKLCSVLGIELNKVECASESDRLTNLAGGFIDIGVVGLGNAQEYSKAGKLKVIGTVAGDGITIDHLTYGYHESAPVLNDVSVRFEAGKSYAIVGTSGSGKSPLVNLLMGSSNDYQGSIRFDQRELRSIATESLYGLVSVVQQNVFIFDDTIHNNITMFRHFDEKLVQQATEKAGLTPLLAERGEDYICGEGGSGLSGGERQRISIARCLLRLTPVLLIDEATAALDAATAYSVSAAILAIEGLTRIVVTHRLEEPLLRKYDEILVLKNGEICERGSFDALMARREQFYSLFNVANG